MPRLARFLVVALAVLAACGAPELVQGVSDSAFVTAMAELRLVMQATALDSASRAAKRDSIMRAHALSPQQLEAAARALARDPERAQKLWYAIEQRVQKDSTSVK